MSGRYDEMEIRFMDWKFGDDVDEELLDDLEFTPKKFKRQWILTSFANDLTNCGRDYLPSGGKPSFLFANNT